MWVALGMIAIVIGITIAFGGLAEINARDNGYRQGYEDCERIHNHYEMSPDDDLLIEELKGALKLYIRHHGLYEKGDVKVIDKTIDWKDFKNTAWNMTVFRKEQKSNGK